MKRFILAIGALLFLAVSAQAASRFWVPLTVTNAISGTGGLCRLTVNNTANLTAGNAVIVAGILGATACDGTTTVTTVVNSTTVEVNLVFNLPYTSGGTVAGGQWTATGTGNWSATTGGAGGQSVPTSADTVTFNGSSGGGTVILNFGGAITVQKITIGAFTGTWDNSVNNNNITMIAVTDIVWDNNGIGTRTINLGSATYTISAGDSQWDTSSTGLTQSSSSANIAFTGTVGFRAFNGAGKTYGSVTVAGTASGPGRIIIRNAAGTISSLVLTAPLYVIFLNSVTHTITSITSVGSSSSQISFASETAGTSTTLAVTTATMAYSAFRDMIFTGSPTATNSFNLGNNIGITITGPVSGGGGCIINGWMLWRDMPEHINDNFPAWLEKAA